MIASNALTRPTISIRHIAIVLVAAAMAYPILLRLLFLVAGQATPPSATTAIEQGVILALLFVLPFAVPGLGLAALLAMRGREDADGYRIRRLALLVVAAPPLFTGTGVVTFLAGIGGWDHLVWWVMWAASIPPWLCFRDRACAATPVPDWLRIGHGIAALLVLLGYVGLHLGNHLTAWWGADAHRVVQLTLRAWYRDPWIEVSLVALLAWLVGSGVALARIYGRRLEMDGYRVLQVAFGANLGAFLLSHLIAALWMARGVLGIDPDWTWAAGGDAGLIGDPWNVRLIPHYFLAVLAVIAHVGLGARVVALGHGAARRTGHAIAVTFGVVGLLVALLLSAALMGARL
ncbi:hypothetical protein ACTJIL_05290 [Luteimonas sp. 22616]|uniref:hypothetical protein n=1 Tax=Luteimonas sp. 22616 TaxID=3453951 RepID=UPI003F839457